MVGLGGSLRELSTSRTALQVALKEAAASGAGTEVMPVAQSWQSFDPDGHFEDEAVAAQLRKLDAEVVRAARQFQAEGTCDYANPGT